jgi:hypothetical protein
MRVRVRMRRPRGSVGGGVVRAASVVSDGVADAPTHVVGMQKRAAAELRLGGLCAK